MELRALGNSGIKVSVLGLGTVKIGRNQKVKYPNAFELPGDDAVADLLAAARDCGINLLDTAPAYGSSEERLGRLLPRDREHWVIVTKVGEFFHDGRSRFDFSAAATRQSVEDSLRRLRTDYLDVVLIHSDGDDERILTQEPVLETLDRLKERGLIRCHGISSKSPAGGLLGVRVSDVVMLTYNPSYRDELPVIEAACEAGKGVLVKKGLQSGHLDSAGMEAAMRFVVRQPGVGSLIVGTINPKHLRHNAALVVRALASGH